MDRIVVPVAKIFPAIDRIVVPFSYQASPDRNDSSPFAVSNPDSAPPATSPDAMSSASDHAATSTSTLAPRQPILASQLQLHTLDNTPYHLRQRLRGPEERGRRRHPGSHGPGGPSHGGGAERSS